MKEQMEIRTYEPGDKERVLELLRLNTPAFFAAEEEQDLVYYLDHELEQYFVVIVDGKLVGAGGINFSEDRCTGKISWDIFDPAYQGKGIGSRLLQFRIDILINNVDIQRITVRTSQLVYPFYERNGFVLQQIVPDYWAKGFDLYQMAYSEK
ncbi:GNAT family N-acetyltransferase [Taibaiella sp. KBW10]|uniref:GNAT family N-acetyltransferase n=1 Tax=Taibaiella sp. KBW10 TaxID=2153357 RepID=UPI000F5AC3C8|nr:GNAT family N-acetyltransferase [Taibaiella sp. KBW10]RQO30723.1 GNAT family N-acetyltransferase [Taibaiella sp. KBW10]